ncbi:methyltransferase regulatory domain-containing protein [Achromobacter xylosoxidans]
MTEPDLLNQAISDAYDETPYLSNALLQTAPGHLRAVARLYGLDSAPLAGARVLELGCAAGGNLIPFAVAHPNAQVIGIDLSPEQVNAGREVVEKLGLRNLDLRALSITDIDDSLGKFDYIICHGVFSWVPPVVREAILRVCRDNLAPEGIAFISYNVYPGWKTSDILRDAMQLNSFSATTPAEKLKKAKEMLGLLQHGLSTNNLMREAISKAAHTLSQQPDHYLFHEYLEMINSPCYFLEFVASIQQAGLAYVSDVQPEGSFPSNYGEATANALAAMSGDADRVMREQYLDFAVGRPFRQSLLVHAERADQILERPEASHFSFHAVFRPIAAGRGTRSGPTRPPAFPHARQRRPGDAGSITGRADRGAAGTLARSDCVRTSPTRRRKPVAPYRRRPGTRHAVASDYAVQLRRAALPMRADRLWQRFDQTPTHPRRPGIDHRQQRESAAGGPVQPLASTREPEYRPGHSLRRHLAGRIPDSGRNAHATA